MIELFSSFSYSLVEASWTAAAITVKYYLAFTAIRLGAGEDLSLSSFEDKILEESITVVSTIFVLGSLILVTGIESDPLLPFFSELTALVYLGFLFWKV